MEDADPFGFAIANDQPESPARVHLLVCDPRDHRLLEAMQRRADGAWVVWTYDCYSRMDLSALPVFALGRGIGGTMEPSSPF